MTRILLVRHGQAICNVERTIEGVGRCRGLSDLGHRQAAAVATRLATEGFAPDHTYVSPIRRAVETATAITNAIGVTFETDADFEELRPGDAEGMTWDQYSAFYGNSEGWNPTVPFAPNAEAWSDFLTRVSGGLDRIANRHEGETVLVVAHGGVVDASLFHYFGLDPMVQSPIDFESANTGLTEWERRSFTVPAGTDQDDSEIYRWRLVRYNDAAHVLVR